MLVIQKHSTKSNKSPNKSTSGLKSKDAKTKPKSAKKKSVDSSICKITTEKVSPGLRISKRLVTRNRTSYDSLSNITKAKTRISKSINNGVISGISKSKNTTPEKDGFLLLQKTELQKIDTTKLGSETSKTLSLQEPLTKNKGKIKKHRNIRMKSTKQGSKNDSEKNQTSPSIIKNNAILKSNLKSLSMMDKSQARRYRKNIKDIQEKVGVNNEGTQMVVIDRPKQKSSQGMSEAKQKSDESIKKFKMVKPIGKSNSKHPTIKTTLSYRKRVIETNPSDISSMQKKINSLELMNKVYPRVEITSQTSTNNSSSHRSNNKSKSNIFTRKFHSDSRNHLKLKSQTLFEFKKPRSAPEQRKPSSRFQKLSSSVPSKQFTATKSFNGSKMGLESSLPKWHMQKLTNTGKEPEIELMTLKAIVDVAKMKHKTFTCCGGYKSIRNALEARDWIERINTYSSGYDDLTKHLYKLPISDLILGIYDKNTGVTHRRVILSKLMGSHQVDLYWDYSNDVYHGNPDSIKLTMINSIQRGVFSYATKHGLCESSKDAYWYHKPGKCHLRHPRSYSVASTQKPEEFMKDFKITACMSLLKWIVDMPRTKSSKLTSDQGKIGIEHFQFAVKECMKFIRKLKHEDIDKTIPESSDKDWNNFLDAYAEAVHRGNHFKTNIHETQGTIIHKSNLVLGKLTKYWPYCDMDGFMNIWILKPSYGSRGIGIHICRTLSYVMKILTENKNHTYVIQKYIEKPLLIFNTKFDIRQWFLISSTSPLTIWIYKECYFRFSSQTYNLRKLHESIHLTNNSVQSRYHSTANRDPSIPGYNMWDLKTFKQHLANIGYGGVYENTIYPGMKECITAAILMNQDHLNKRRNSFQLHGADFMLTEDFEPWLIEINARPALYSSTPITASMCPRVLTDTIRVVIDLKENRNASTGLFELLYKEEIEKLPNTIFDPNVFVIQGHAIRKDYFQTPEQAIAEGDLCNSKKSSEIMDITNNKNFILQVGKEMRSTLEQLLALIHNEKKRRIMLRTQLSGSNTVKKEELKQLYKKENYDGALDNIQDRSSIELQSVLYNTLSNHVLNSISKDAQQLHGMITRELRITTSIHSTKTIHEKSSVVIQKPESWQTALGDVRSLPSGQLSEHSANAESIEFHNEVAVMKPTGGLLNNIFGMISSLSFN